MFITFLTHSLDGSRAFYERLGYSFADEQHGNGPRHFSTTLSALPLELHPPINSIGAEALFIGIYVNGNTDTVKQDLIENYGGQEVEPPITTTKSGIASLRDPGGILIRLFPQP